MQMAALGKTQAKGRAAGSAVALLAYLVCTRRRHSREALATLLWPEYADARNALRRTPSSIQRTLGTGWLDIGRDGVSIAQHPAL